MKKRQRGGDSITEEMAQRNLLIWRGFGYNTFHSIGDLRLCVKPARVRLAGQGAYPLYALTGVIRCNQLAICAPYHLCDVRPPHPLRAIVRGSTSNGPWSSPANHEFTRISSVLRKCAGQGHSCGRAEVEIISRLPCTSPTSGTPRQSLRPAVRRARSNKTSCQPRGWSRAR
jgi:hypothetical protein